MSIEGFGKKFKEARESLGLSKADVARKLGIHWDTLNKWEKEERTPKPTSIEKLQRVLDINPEKPETWESKDGESSIRIQPIIIEKSKPLIPEALLKIQNAIKEIYEMDPYLFAQIVELSKDYIKAT